MILLLSFPVVNFLSMVVSVVELALLGKEGICSGSLDTRSELVTVVGSSWRVCSSMGGASDCLRAVEPLLLAPFNSTCPIDRSPAVVISGTTMDGGLLGSMLSPGAVT